MNNAIKILPKESGENYAVVIERTTEFTQKAQAISEFIKSLPLTSSDNDKLVYAITEQIQLAEEAAYKQGFNMGIKISKEKDS